MKRLLPLFLGVVLALPCVFPRTAFATLTDTSGGRRTYTGDGSTTVFAFTFPVTSKADVLATVTTAGVVSTPTFTTVINSDQIASPGGSVTFAVAPGASTTVTIYRSQQLTQTTVLPPFGPFPAKTVEKSMDSIMMKVQQIDRDRADLAAKEAADISNVISGGVGAANLIAPIATGGTAAIPLATRFAYVLNVRDFAPGGVCSGVSDDTAALISANTYANANSKALIIDCKLRIATAAGTISAPLKFESKGALDLSPAGGSITLTSGITAPLGQIFFTGAGTLTFSSKTQVVPQWWGAVADGSTDDTAACQAAIAAASTVGTKGGTVLFPPGGVYVCGSLLITAPNGNNNVMGEKSVQLIGYGATLKGRASDSTIINVAPPVSPLTLANGVNIEGFTLDMSAMPNASTTYGISIQRSYSGTVAQVRVIGQPSTAYSLYIGGKVYTYAINSFNGGNIKIQGNDNTSDQSTTITFVALVAYQVVITNAFGITFLQPVIQGSADLFVLNQCFDITVVGGDLEGLAGRVYNFGTNVNYVTSINNNVSAQKTYSVGVAFASNLSDRFRGTFARAIGRPQLQITTTAATTIYSLTDSITPGASGGVLMIVTGDDGTNGFSDLILYAIGSIKLISGNTMYGAPPARTYTWVSPNIQLALASVAAGAIRVSALEYLGN